MKFFSRFILPILSGVLLFSAWPMSPLTIFIFIAWVPLLIIENRSTNPYRFFLILLINLLIWNTATTWWIWNASEGGALGAIIANSILMTIPWMLFRMTKQKLGRSIGYISFILYFICFEYIHHNWELSWPWLTLGNVFANHPDWIRWYQYTGTTGGSLWVLIGNIVIYNALPIHKHSNAHIILNNQLIAVNSFKSRFRQIGIALFILLFPIIYSLIAWNPTITTKEATNNVVLIQPNINPYNEKFSTDPSLQIEKLLRLSESKIDSNTRLVVWPETAVPVQVWEDQIKTNPFYQPIFNFLQRHSQLMLVTGIDSYKNYGTQNPGGYSIRKNELSNTYYEAFNTAVALDSSSNIKFYHKAKLVPGVETLPSWLAFLGKIFEDYGGISGTLGKSKEPIFFSSNGNIYKPAPVICYESIYSEYVTEYIRKGANIIAIITNDGWWGNTPGYHQHQSYARLRAVETGCWVVRSANTGISCFISPAGEVINPQPWETQTAIKLSISPIETKTFYVQYGDWISRIIFLLSALMLVATFTARWWVRK